MKIETKNENSMFKMSIKRVLIVLLLLILTGFILGFCNATNTSAQTVKRDSIEYKIIDTPINIVLPHDSIRNMMIEETNKYITKCTRGKHDSKLAEYLVDNALKHNIDLCFMLGQTKIETCFGTAGAGKASSRRSLFGIIKKKWSNYNDAINDYCLLLKKSYLVKGRTEQDLMNRYVSGAGYRYAGSLTYERELRNTYNSICSVTNIRELQNEYTREYNIFLASQTQSDTVASSSDTIVT